MINEPAQETMYGMGAKEEIYYGLIAQYLADISGK